MCRKWFRFLRCEVRFPLFEWCIYRNYLIFTTSFLGFFMGARTFNCRDLHELCLQQRNIYSADHVDSQANAETRLTIVLVFVLIKSSVIFQLCIIIGLYL